MLASCYVVVKSLVPKHLQFCNDPVTNAKVKLIQVFDFPRYVLFTIVIMIGKVITISLHLLADHLILKRMKDTVLWTKLICVATWTF